MESNAAILRTRLIRFFTSSCGEKYSLSLVALLEVHHHVFLLRKLEQVLKTIIEAKRKHNTIEFKNMD